MKAAALSPFLFGLLLIAAAPAFSAYRCESGGSVTYSDLPCPDGRRITASAPSRQDAAAARKKALKDQRELRRIESDQRKRDAAEEKERLRLAQAQAAKQKRCAELGRRHRWAEEDARAATGKASTRARRKAERIGEQVEAQCGR